MADFNQSPASQASIAAAVSSISVGVGATTVNVSTEASISSVFGASSTFNLSAALVAATGMFPTWRRSARVVSSS